MSKNAFLPPDARRQGRDSNRSRSEGAVAPGKVPRTSRLTATQGALVPARNPAHPDHARAGRPGGAGSLSLDPALLAGVAPFSPPTDRSAGSTFDQATGGAPAPLPYKTEMEAVFGEDLSSVEAHVGRHAEMTSLGAHAASQGERVAFAGAAPDRELVAHELTHVVQSRRAGTEAVHGDSGVSRPDDPAEIEARAMASRATRALPRQDNAASGTGLAREIHARPGARPEARDNPTPAMAVDPDPGNAGAAQHESSPDPSEPEPDAGRSQSAADNTETESGAEPGAEPEATPDTEAKPGAESGATPEATPGPGQPTPAGAHGEVAASQPRAGQETPLPAAGAALEQLEGVTPSEFPRAHQAARQTLAQTMAEAPLHLAALAASSPDVHEQPQATDHGRPTGAPDSAAPRPGHAEPAPSAGHTAPMAHADSSDPQTQAAERRQKADKGTAWAGPRPRIEVEAEAGELHAGQQRGSAGVRAHLARANQDAAMSAPRPPLPAPPPQPAIPDMAAPSMPAIEPLTEVPAEARPIMDQLMAPVIEERVAQAQSKSQEITAAAAAERAALEEHRHAENTRFQAQEQELLQRGDTQVAAVRQAWQADNQRVEQAHQALVEQQQTRAHAQVETEVQAGEQEVDSLFTETETRADADLAAAQAEAEAMVARAREQAAARSAAPEPGGQDPVMRQDTGENDGIVAGALAAASEMISRVQEQIKAMMTAAQDAGARLRDQLLEQLLMLLVQNDELLNLWVQQTLAEFPMMAYYYEHEIAALLGQVGEDLQLLAEARTSGDDAAIAQYQANLDASLREFGYIFTEVSMIGRHAASTGTRSDGLEAIREEFGITFDGTWSESCREVALLGAVLTERGFRRAGMLDGRGFGEGFNAIFGGINMDSEGGGWGARTTSAHNIDWYRNVSTEPNLNYDENFDYYLFDTQESLLYNVIHEYGHAFDERIGETARNLLDGAMGAILPISSMVMDSLPMRQSRRNEELAAAEDPHFTAGEIFPDIFMNFVLNNFDQNDPEQAQLVDWMQDNLGDFTDAAMEATADEAGAQRADSSTQSAAVNGQSAGSNASQPAGNSASPAGGAQAQHLPDGSILHIVQSGDTLIGLANQFGVSDWTLIATANNLPLDNPMLSIGQELIIPQDN